MITLDIVSRKLMLATPGAERIKFNGGENQNKRQDSILANRSVYNNVVACFRSRVSLCRTHFSVRMYAATFRGQETYIVICRCLLGRYNQHQKCSSPYKPFEVNL